MITFFLFTGKLTPIGVESASQQTAGSSRPVRQRQREPGGSSNTQQQHKRQRETERARAIPSQRSRSGCGAAPFEHEGVERRQNGRNFRPEGVVTRPVYPKAEKSGRNIGILSSTALRPLRGLGARPWVVGS
jgi:hypothetical protein